MWLKAKRTKALLERLAPMIGGEVSKGHVKGSHHGYGVDAWPHRGEPIIPMARPVQGGGPHGIDMFRATVLGVAGHAIWQCQSSPSSVMQQAVANFGPLSRLFGPGEFKFVGADPLRESFEGMGGKLAKRLGVPVALSADKSLQERLVAAGLLEQLDALRWGPHPYLPKAAFFPPGRELVDVYKHSPAFARVEPRASERLRELGLPDFESMITEHMEDADASAPGRLVLEVQVGKARVPAPERFRDLLDVAVRIAQINLEANLPA